MRHSMDESAPVGRVPSARLVIEPLRSRHTTALAAYRALPECALLQSWGTDFSLADARRLVIAEEGPVGLAPGDWIQLALVLVPRGGPEVLVGDIGVHQLSDQPRTYELGITVAPAHQGRGFASESLGSVIDWLMDCRDAHRVTMRMDARNEPMIAVARALGMRHEGADLEGDWFKGQWTTLERYALLRRERHSPDAAATV
jgi:RimJ/RimL family protein N-acetyltransferase